MLIFTHSFIGSSTMAATVIEFLLLLLSVSVFFHSISGQNPSGFISLDCGIPPNSSYIEPNTNINYDSDAAFINSGTIHNISSVYVRSTLKQQLWSLRSFPEGVRNCYKVRVKSGTKYLIRASFLYGDYDSQKKIPGFDLYFGPNFWTSVKLDAMNTTEHLEIMHIVSSNWVELCLINTGAGTPFISALELRPLPNFLYETRSESLATFLRLDVGSATNLSYRYKDDIYDRIWYAMVQLPAWTILTTTEPIDTNDPESFMPPQPVMTSAATPINATAPMEFSWVSSDETAKFYVIMFFSEIQKLQPNESRVFDILLNGNPWTKGQISLPYLQGYVSYSTTPITGGTYDFALVRTPNSTHPPLLNAIEIYRVIDFPQSPTDEQDVEGILDIKAMYEVGRNWEGDPCVPREFIWQGVNCSFVDSQPPRITLLDLSSSGLTGEISKELASLKLLETLDLSNNSLNGEVPEFLTQLPSLRVLNLERNNLSGRIPSQLIEKSNDGSLSLSYGENPNLFINTSPSEKKGESNIVVPLVASVIGGFVLLLFIISGVIFWIKRKQGVVLGEKKQLGSIKRSYSYADILRITNNLERMLGVGGFGKVYYGQSGDTEVAVKMLSPQSVQGYDQFQAEVDLLLRVHHRNLTGLVGYCDEPTYKGLIYEYMARGNLGSFISSGKAKVLDWEDRLRIAVDSAHGLEYLHYGIKPAIIHRDVKSTNILLDEDFRAKVSDFGLSKAFLTENGASHVNATNVVGTFGYIDPEYYTTSQLNEKSDVFGFGVILLEIFTGKPALMRGQDNNVTHIYNWVNMLISQGDIRSIIDPEMGEDFDVNSVWKAVDVAMSCVSSKSKDRPNMSQVVVDLKECLAMESTRDHKRHHESQTSVAQCSALPGPLAR
ncbi:putative leucine-rich repeat receptor-like protein kinase At2g19210 isoform X2 [Benincasa hispida]|uniref:putative leucine-rich repeat receptor-like protein kinase At2g19210 isoform X2 n=1 Tax=Benincasa hispida TaxID=102211 RepID=UPI0019015045|nr:putative leucine-rich repeat receptor-like protein kinase At2g19210 isoform X2 [Benincasa hispida]